MKKEIQRFLCFLMTLIMVLTSMPHQLLASYDYNDLSDDKSKIINKIKNVEVAKPKTGQTAEDFVKDPAQPAIYTLRTDYKAEKGEGYKVNYQPYVATVGADASSEEQAKVNKDIKLPDMAGYDKPKGEDVLKIKYDNIVKLAKGGQKKGDEKNGYNFLEIQDKKYKARVNSVVIKHVFQDMDDFNTFTNRKTNTITEEKTVQKEVDGEKKYVKEGWVYKKKTDGNFESEPYKKYDLSKPEEKAEFLSYEETTTDKGNTGSTLEVQALQENQRPGFVPQIEKLKTQVPEDTRDFKIEYRYNRAHYDVVFDTQDGTPLPTRSYYYEQEIPKIEENSIPKKTGCEFLGWKPSHDLEGLDGTKYKKDKIITDKKGNAIVDFGNIYYKKNSQGEFELKHDEQVKAESTEEIKLKMPALALGDGKNIPREKLTFTAVWKDKEKADYAIQFWVEKSDHADNAGLMDKYDYMGTRVYEQQPTGKRPNLDDEKPGPVEIQVNGTTKTLPGLNFPDLNDTRLQKIWKGPSNEQSYKGPHSSDSWFNRGRNLYLNKFYVYNKKLTDDQNKDSKEPTLTKKVLATGKTVYNIYYDRQVYDLYFTKSNAQPAKNTIYPEIWGYDPAKGEAVKLGGPGKPYHYKARFNEMMYKWPNDAKQTKGFTPGYQSFGWGPNYSTPNFPTHLDTPPYRLNADQFLDMDNYTSWGGYTKHIDKGDGTTKDLDRFDFTTLSFGIKQDEPSIPHHMDFWMDGFKPNETIIRYDLVRTKADTGGLDYGHRYPLVTGFTPYGYEPNNPQSAWPVIKEGSEEKGRVDEEGINDLNDEREDTTPNNCGTYYNNNGIKLPIGQLDFIKAFFSDSDEFGDVKEDVQEFTENGYLRFKYTRNKYKLRFNYDPSKIKGDTEFNSTNQLETFYEFPLACLSPDLVDSKLEREDREYFKENPKSLIDIPENLQKMGLTELVDKDKNGKLKIKRPEGVSDQSVFKGWALDPAGTKLVWKNKGEKMPTHPLNLYAKWGEPDYKWKVTIDPNGGTLPVISADKPNELTTEKIKIKEGEGENEKEVTYPVVGYEGKNKPTGDEDKDKSNPQVFTVVQRQKLNNLPKPERYGYDFLGWEVVRYKKDKNNDDKYTDEVDNDYRTRYKVPELYTFGQDVVSPITLKAIWVENKRADVTVRHYKLTKDFKFDEKIYPNPQLDTLEYKRVGDYVPTTAGKQDENWILATNDELMNKLPPDLKDEYIKYNNRVKMNNTFFQTFQVLDNIKGGTKDNPVYTPNPENEFIFFYRPFRTRDYKVNYLDERGKKEVEAFYKGLGLADTAGLTGDELLEAQKANKKKFKAGKQKLKEILDKYKLVDQEKVVSKCRHFDARNYRPIPGWKLVGDPQQQLFYDVNEDTNEFLGINGTSVDQIFFYYKDARVIEVPKDGKTPDGYVRVTFKADKGGSFTDKAGKPVKELHYDVIKGLKSDFLPVPEKLKSGETKVDNKYYITPETGKKFVEWKNGVLLNKDTIVNENYTFTACFDWSGLSTSSNGLVRTEAYNDPEKIKANPADPTVKAKDWTNKFAPTIDELKAQLVWKENGTEKPIPSGTDIKLFVGDTELTKDEQVYDLVKEMNKLDKDETVRTINVEAKVTFKDGTGEQTLPIPITVYKNRYEALNKEGDKPLYLKEAEGKDAEHGGLKELLSDTTHKKYIKVTVRPNKDFDNKDDKVYFVNPKAWVEIPEVATTGDSTFTNWTADNKQVNEEQKDKGVFDFTKRHKFTEDTIITPVGAKDVVEQKDPTKKPNVPESYVKVIVKTTDKATTETAFERTFWVNPTREVAIGVNNPTGKKDQEVEVKDGKGNSIGKKKVEFIFKGWQKVKTGEADDKLKDVTPEKIDLAKHKYTDKVTVVQEYYGEKFDGAVIATPTKTKKLDTPKGKEITDDDLIKQITPQKGKEIASVQVISKPDGKTVGNEPAKVIVKYKDGSSVGTNDNPVVIPVEVHDNIIPEVVPGQKPEGAMKNYVKVTFTAGEGGKLDKTLTGNFVYYVSPEVEADFTDIAGKITKTPDVGYVSGNWDTSETKKLKDTFKSDTEFTFNFTKNANVVEKTDDPNQVIPDRYVTVTFKTEDANKGMLSGNVEQKVYYVNPEAGITLKVLGENETATDKQLAVPATTAQPNFKFSKWQETIDEQTPITGDREYVAMFAVGQVTLTYDAGGAKGDVPENVIVNYGTTVRLAGKGTLDKPNAEFAGWKLDGEDKIYQPGDQVKLEKARTATAQWTTNSHTVTFDTNGGSKVDSQTVEHGKTATEPKAPTQDGKVFMGWKENASDENYFDFNTQITANKTLIAIWQDSVQKINDGSTVEPQFIKVTFLKGLHGTLKDGEASNVDKVTYKVAKGLKFADAKGLKVPEIAPAKYYKAKSANDGWDKKLELNGQNVEFTAQYEPKADVIPVDPKVTDDKLQEEKPEGMVLVEFVVDDSKAFMLATSKFYVAINKDVIITPPTVYNRPGENIFSGWEDVTLNSNKLLESKFTKDKVISPKGAKIVEMEITEPKAGLDFVAANEKSLAPGVVGKLEIIRENKKYIIESQKYTSTKKIGRRTIKQVRFGFNIPKEIGKLKSGDIVRNWAIKGSMKSNTREITVK